MTLQDERAHRAEHNDSPTKLDTDTATRGALSDAVRRSDVAIDPVADSAEPPITCMDNALPFPFSAPCHDGSPSSSTDEAHAPDTHMLSGGAPVIADIYTVPADTSLPQHLAPSIYAGIAGGVVGMVCTILVLPYWSNANNASPAPGMGDATVSAVPLIKPSGHAVVEHTKHPVVSPDTIATSDASSVLPSSPSPRSVHPDEAWRSGLRLHNRKMLSRIDDVNKELADLLERFEQIGGLSARVDTLDAQVHSVLSANARRHRQPAFVATAIKQLGGQSWVSVTNPRGDGAMLRLGDYMLDWRVSGIDVLAGVVVFEHREGSRYRVVL